MFSDFIAIMYLHSSNKTSGNYILTAELIVLVLTKKREISRTFALKKCELLIWSSFGSSQAISRFNGAESYLALFRPRAFKSQGRSVSF
jgi:hypothetical protein